MHRYRLLPNAVIVRAVLSSIPQVERLRPIIKAKNMQGNVLFGHLSIGLFGLDCMISDCKILFSRHRLWAVCVLPNEQLYKYVNLIVSFIKKVF